MSNQNDIILEARRLTKQFSGFYAVRDVDLKVRRRGVHALIGPNGAGKTTVFNLLSRFLPASSGEIVYDGRDITNERPARVARLGLVRSFQISSVFPRLTVRDNVRLALQRQLGTSFHFWLSGKSLDALNGQAAELVASVGLQRWLHTPASELPYGRKRALEFATTLALAPKMFMLDEPMAGLSQEDISRVSQLVRKLAETHTVLMVEHNLSVVADLSDVITVMARGQIIAQGGYREISSDTAVRQAYLGSSDV